MTGRPCGSKDFIMRLEEELDRILQPQKSGRKPKPADVPDPTEGLFAGF